jgi:hypothetical protein
MMRAMRTLMACLGVLSMTACGGEERESVGRSSHEIIQGELVPDGDLPTLIGILTNAGSICTGTLISPTAVLTAAHCVDPMIIKQSVQVAGMTPPDVITYQASFSRNLRAAAGQDLLTVASVDWHAEFLQDANGLFEKPGRWNDLGLVHLAQPLTGHRYGLLASPDVVAALEMNGSQLVAGYGLSNETDVMSAGVLKRGLSGFDEVGEFEIIAGVGDAQQACRGDSGGPIFADETDTLQVGIASRVNSEDLIPTSAACNTGLLYTRVDAYLDWITERVPDLGDPGDPGDPGNPGGGDDGGCSVSRRGGGAPPLWLMLLGLLVWSRSRCRGSAASR